MNPADLEMLAILVLGPLNVALPLLLVALDFRLLLTPEQQARTWPDATLGSAALLVGPLMLPFHFAMSRWGGRYWGLRPVSAAMGFLVGALLLGLVSAFNQGVVWLLEWIALGRVESG